MNPSLRQWLAGGLAHHQQGHFADAERSYRAVLERAPANADALHLFGVLALQTGNPRSAVERILRAIAIEPNRADYHSHLGEAYRLLGDAERAAAACRSALAIDPANVHAMNNLGVALLDQGRPEEAREVLREVVLREPGFAMAHNGLGNALRSLGDREGAVAAFRRAVAADPGCAEAHANLGQLLLEKGDRRAALEHCRHAVALQPSRPQALNNLGNALRETGELEEAKRCYEQALHLDSGSAVTLANTAQALQEEGRLGDALLWYERALEADPSSARTFANLGTCLAEMERPVDARRAYETALAHDPASVEGHVGLANLWREEGAHDRALAHYRRALAAAPNRAAAHAGLALLHAELGRFTEAEALLREAIRIEPDNGEHHAELAMLLHARLPDADLDAMRRLVDGARQRPARLEALHFALAQALDTRGHYAEAAAHAGAGNSLQRERLALGNRGYDPAEHRAFVDETIATFTPDFFHRSRGWSIDTELPVFVVGLPRSGTTLVEQILASHPRVHGAGELPLVRKTFDSFARRSPEPAAARAAATRHLERLRRLAPTADRIVDKMPDNYLYVGLLHALFPKARIILCQRDLGDVALSAWMTNFRSIRWAASEEHILSRICEYRRIVEHWRRVLPDGMLEIRYEEVVTDLEFTARRLVAELGLEWSSACLEFHKSPRPVRTASIVQVRQPLYRTAVGRARRYAPFVARLLGPLRGD